MPRKSRQVSNTKVYHVILRGIDKQDIFVNEKDYYNFLQIIKETKEKFDYEIYSYCLMTNHVHIVIYDKNNQLSKIMQRIEISYSMYFNKKYNRQGHLFQNRFLSKKIEDREYLKIVCRYIHQNPLKAGIEKTEKYKWSSYKEYIRKNTLINPRMLLLLFSENQHEAKEEFIKFHNIEINLNPFEQIEYEMQDKIIDEDVYKYITKLLNMEYEEIKNILRDKNKRDEIITRCKKIKGITNRQLARVLGINRKIIDRVK